MKYEKIIVAAIIGASIIACAYILSSCGRFKLVACGLDNTWLRVIDTHTGVVFGPKGTSVTSP